MLGAALILKLFLRNPISAHFQGYMTAVFMSTWKGGGVCVMLSQPTLWSQVCVSNHIPQFHGDVITYPRLNPDADLNNLV